MEIENISSSEDDQDSRQQQVIASTTATVVATDRSSRISNEETSRSKIAATNGASETNDATHLGTAQSTVQVGPRTTSGSRNRVSPTPDAAITAQPTSSDREGRGRSSWLEATRPVTRPLIEEEPPQYITLFPQSTTTVSHPTANRHYSQPLTQTSYPTVPIHPQPPPPPHLPMSPCRCSVCSTSPHSIWPNPHHSYHTGPALTGALGHHHYPELHHPPSGTTQYHHTTVPQTHHHSRVPPHLNIPDDYLKLSFVCVLLCTLQFNLPALFCILPALAYSLRAQKLNTEGRHRRAQKYGRGALTCNLLALTQYILCMVIAIALLYVWVFSNV